MPLQARICLGAGALSLVACIINQWTAGDLDPALERSSVLASLLAVGLMLVGILWTRASPQAAAAIPLQGRQGLVLRQDLPARLAEELDWGSRLLLTATPAAVVLVWDRGEVVLRRGLLVDEQGQEDFQPAAICRQAWDRQRPIHLVDLKHYPGRVEFEPLLPSLPSVVVQPIDERSLLLIGGSAPRCFSRGDLVWMEGWADRLRAAGPDRAAQASLSSSPASASSSEPLRPEH